MNRSIGLLSIVLLAGLPLMAQQPSAGPLSVALEAAAGSVATPKGVVEYRLYSPEPIEAGRRYPLVLFLHGSGERGTNNTAQLKFGVRDLLKWGKVFGEPMFLLAPQCPPGQKWVEVPWDRRIHPMPKEPSDPMRGVVAALEKVCRECPVDPARIYLTGLSMGGYGCWDLLGRKPGFFAAAMPVCGSGDPAQARGMVETPIWAVHGSKDGAVPVAHSAAMIQAIRGAGGKRALFHEIPGAGHDVWSRTYSNPMALRWLFEQRNPNPPSL
ncbi:MAG: prolyl oligopeptidase family serine peptidase [Kiritimatiellia bacterium]